MEFHFYASSVGEWQVSNDLGDLIARMKKHGLNFAIWKVPGNKLSATYEIKNYAPMVEGKVYLGSYFDAGKRWVMKTIE